MALQPHEQGGEGGSASKKSGRQCASPGKDVGQHRQRAWHVGHEILAPISKNRANRAKHRSSAVVSEP
jgi:hypothetical protein